MSGSRATLDLVKVLRQRLLTFTPIDGSATLSFRLGGRIYIDRAPKEPEYPFAVLRLSSMQSDGAYNQIRKTGDLEVLIWHKGDGAARTTVEKCADIAEQALYRLWLDAPGLVFSRQSQRTTLPPAPEVVDEQTVAVRLLFPIVFYPQYLTLYDS